MAKEYKGGHYVFFEYIGLYIRYFLCKLFRHDKTLSELSGEKDYPNIDKRERIICLLVGIFAIAFLLLLVVGIGHYYSY
ncbi:MAG: hypothetical protein MJZ87_04530 [Bacteroidales bacterium]|nr:hypothetical protein [Bacteroidales bacterium]